MLPKRQSKNPAKAAEIAITNRNVANIYKGLEYGSYAIGGISLLKGIGRGIAKTSKRLISGPTDKTRRKAVKAVSKTMLIGATIPIAVIGAKTALKTAKTSASPHIAAKAITPTATREASKKYMATLKKYIDAGANYRNVMTPAEMKLLKTYRSPQTWKKPNLTLGQLIRNSLK